MNVMQTQTRTSPFWVRAVQAPFRSRQSLISLAIGSLPSLAFWADLPGFRWLAILLSFGSAGYSVLVIRTALAASASGEPFDLPPWFDDLTALVKCTGAALLGAVAVVLPVLVVIWLIIELLTLVTMWHVVPISEMYSVVQLALDNSSNGSAYILISLPVYAAFIWLVMFVPTMMVHYAREDRFLAVFEWRTIQCTVESHFRPLLLVPMVIITVVAFLNGALHAVSPALSVVGFAADVITWALIAHACSTQSKGE